MITKFSLYLSSLRAYSFPLSISSALIGPAWAYSSGHKIDSVRLFLICATVLLFHGAVNMLNDYYDYNRGVDTNERQRAVQRNAPGFLLHYALLLFFIGASFGAALVYLSGLPMLVMGFIGAVLSFFYTGKKFSLKYMALGELTVFITFGPLLGLASLYAVSRTFSLHVALLSSAPGLLAALVLFLNNLRDIDNDKKAHIKTLPMYFAKKTCTLVALSMLILPYIIIVCGTIPGFFTAYLLLILLSLPVAIPVIKVIFSNNGTPDYDKALMGTIRIHTLFTVLCITGLVAPVFFRRLFEN
ncbi:MAG: prenyltransferase [Spirochaetes bacterium]|nr:prenyltransferase [Spirochaetota bacterium]MBN2769592.1 prenyltransferase [Spirochaetota bacterium]